MPILEGVDGVQKMSKSLGNYIGIAEPGDEMFGKLMSISDDLMWRYFELLSFRPLSEIEALKAQMRDGRNPRDIKFELGRELVARFHSPAVAEQAQHNFVARFQKGMLPDDMPEVSIATGGSGLAVANVLKQANLTSSTSDALRMIRQGAVRIDGERIQDTGLIVASGTVGVFQVGKRRFARISID
jgi:tyrosyl-tRNA synthetase